MQYFLALLTEETIVNIFSQNQNEYRHRYWVSRKELGLVSESWDKDTTAVLWDPEFCSKIDETRLGLGSCLFILFSDRQWWVSYVWMVIYWGTRNIYSDRIRNQQFCLLKYQMTLFYRKGNQCLLRQSSWARTSGILLSSLCIVN